MNNYDSINELLKSVHNYVDNTYYNISTSGEISKINIHTKYNTAFLELRDSKLSMDASLNLFNYDDDFNIGDEIKINGRLVVRGSRLRFIIKSYELCGQGDEIKKIEDAKKILCEKGYFHNKKEIKDNYEKIGIISSLNAAGLKDFINTIKQRTNKCNIIIYESAMQGKNAPKQIINALNLANKHNKVDILILTRGGGSRDDLSCFDDIELAETIATSIIPTITGIGHQIDTCLCDLVCDKSFITPTATAEGITKDDKKSTINRLIQLKQQIKYLMRNKLVDIYKSFENYKKKLKINIFNTNNYENIKKELQLNMKMYINNIFNELNNRYNNIEYLYSNIKTHHSKNYNDLVNYKNNIKFKMNNKIINYDNTLKKYENDMKYGKIIFKHKGKIINDYNKFKNIIKEENDFIIYINNKPIRVNIYER